VDTRDKPEYDNLEARQRRLTQFQFYRGVVPEVETYPNFLPKTAVKKTQQKPCRSRACLGVFVREKIWGFGEINLASPADRRI
jgi:hypothetical protein